VEIVPRAENGCSRCSGFCKSLQLSQRTKKWHVAVSYCLGCSRCSAFAQNFLKGQRSGTWHFHVVQAVQAFAQTLSGGQEKVLGKFTQSKLSRLFGLFGLFRLLHKLSHKSKKQQSKDIVPEGGGGGGGRSGCSGFCANFLTLQKVARGSFTVFRLFRLFRLLRKLSREYQSGTWESHGVRDVQAFIQTFSRDKVQRHVANSPPPPTRKTMISSHVSPLMA
jgi:hypothetical protein